MLTCQKHLFSLPDDVHYLNGASMSPLPKPVEEAGIAGLLRKSRPYEITPSAYFEGVDRVKALFARLINGTADRVAVIPSVSYGMAVVARNLRARPGQHILLIEGEFPSDYYAWEDVCRTKELTIRTITDPKQNRGPEWNRRILEAISAETALVVLAPVNWSDGLLFDVAAIGKRCRETDTLFVLDGTQCVGAFPVDVAAAHADALVVAGYKWLMSAYSLGLAWYGPAFDGGDPIEYSWINRKGAQDFRLLMDYTSEYREGASRYSMGEQSNFIQIPMLEAGLQLLLSWTPEGVQSYCRELVGAETDTWRSLGYEIEEAGHRAAHLFGLKHPTLSMDRLREALGRHRVYISTRGTTLRVAPHVYNTPEDIRALTQALTEAI